MKPCMPAAVGRSAAALRRATLGEGSATGSSSRSTAAWRTGTGAATARRASSAGSLPPEPSLSAAQAMMPTAAARPRPPATWPPPGRRRRRRRRPAARGGRRGGRPARPRVGSGRRPAGTGAASRWVVGWVVRGGERRGARSGAGRTHGAGGPGAQEVADLRHRPAVGRLAGHRGLEQRGQPAGVREPRRLLVHDPVERAHQVARRRRTAAGRPARGRASRPATRRRWRRWRSAPEATSGAR